ncbi:hypothetical protein NZK32_17740 [Cyanobium sp. FGCU-52]|nr:hypothetical protein [Cyanobium sp. FGCU52]
MSSWLTWRGGFSEVQQARRRGDLATALRALMAMAEIAKPVQLALPAVRTCCLPGQVT